MTDVMEGLCCSAVSSSSSFSSSERKGLMFCGLMARVMQWVNVDQSLVGSREWSVL